MPDHHLPPKAVRCARCNGTLPQRGNTGLCTTCLLGGLLAVVAETQAADSGDDWLNSDDQAAEAAPAASAEAQFSGYELLGEIARGGMGVVYRARQRQPNRLVALKVLLPRRADAADTLARFRAEVAIVASLDHPNLLPVYETGEYEGQPFFSMKLVEGGSLAGRIGEFAGQHRAAARLVALAAGAVHHAHQRGVLHRDLKPGNILLQAESEPLPYVTDFGIAKVLNSDAALTLTHDVLGTPAYAAPEQASPGLADVTTAADVYGLGAILYELLAQRPPFTGATPLETLRRVVDETPVPPRAADPNVPRDLETICLKCLQKDPRARYASAAGLAADLKRFLTGETVLARTTPARERIWRWARRNPALAALWTTLALFVVTVAVGATMSAWRLKVEKGRAVQAERQAVAARNEAVENLRASNLVGARALRGTIQAGHRFEALALIKKAAAIRPGFDLRNEAIAALALTDVASEKQWEGSKDTLYGPVAFDPTLQYCASKLLGEEYVSVWKFANHKHVCKLEANDADHTRVRTIGPWSNAHLPLVTEGGTVRVYHTDPAGQARLAFALPAWFPPSSVAIITPGEVAFSPDDKTMAVCLPDGGVSLRDANDGHELRCFARGRMLNKVVFNVDGSQLVLAAVGGREARRWNLAEDREEQVYPAQGGIINLAVSPSDRLVALATDQSNISLFDYRSGEERRTIRWQGSMSKQIAFDPRGLLLASTGRDLALKLWQPVSGNLLLLASGLSAEPALRFSDDGTRIANSPYSTGVVGTLRLQGEDCVRNVVPSRGGGVGYDSNTLDISPDGRLFAVATDNGVCLGDLRGGRELACWLLDTDRSQRTTLQFTSDGRGLVVCNEQKGRWFRALTWEDPVHLTWGPPRQLDDALGWVLLSPRIPGGLGAFLRLDANEISVRPVDASGATDDPKEHLKWDEAVEGNLWQGELSRDGRYLATTAAGSVRASHAGCHVWDAATGRLVSDCGPCMGGNVCFSPGGRYLYASGVNTLVYETAHWQKVFTVPYDTTQGAFSADDRILAVRDESTRDGKVGVIRLFAMPGGEPLAVLETDATQMLFSDDSRYLVTFGTGAPVQIWDLPTIRRELRALNLDWSNEPVPEPEPAPPIIFREP